MTLEGIDTVHDMTHKTLKTMCPLKKIIVFHLRINHKISRTHYS